MYKSLIFLFIVILSGCQGWPWRQSTSLHLDQKTQNIPVYKVILTLNDFYFELEIQKHPLDQRPSSHLDPDAESDPDVEPDPDIKPDPDTEPEPDTEPDTNTEPQTSPEESLSPFPGSDDDWMILPDL